MNGTLAARAVAPFGAREATHHGGLFHVHLQLRDVTEVVHVEEDGKAGQHSAELPLDYCNLVLARAPSVKKRAREGARAQRVRAGRPR